MEWKEWMMKLRINKKEANATWIALEYYVCQATHDPNAMNGCAGLPEGKEKDYLESVMNKLLKQTKK